MNIIIADNNNPRRLGLSALALEVKSINSVIEVSNSKELFDSLRMKKVERVLVSTSFAGGDLKEIILRIKSKWWKTKVLLIIEAGEIIFPKTLLSANLDGSISSNEELDRFRFALRIFIESGRFIPFNIRNPDSRIPMRAGSDDIFAKLTKSERFVIDSLMSGLKIRQISDQLAIASTTTCTYRKRAFAKLKISDLTQLISMVEISRKLA